MRQFAELLERLRELQESNGDRELTDLIPLAGETFVAAPL